MVCVDKGEWDKGGTSDYINEFNHQWLSLCREKLKDNADFYLVINRDAITCMEFLRTVCKEIEIWLISLFVRHHRERREAKDASIV